MADIASKSPFSPYRADGKLRTVPLAFTIIPYPLSPSSEDSTLTLIDDILNTWGRLDVWVCSSGLLGPASITETTPSDLQKCWEANALGPFFALKYAPPAMGKLCEKRNYTNSEVKDQGYGSIVVVGSVAGGYGGWKGGTRLTSRL
ncbi:MAG: hypothetical protein Q9197_001557 [Variospora fuerteventurae]